MFVHENLYNNKCTLPQQIYYLISFAITGGWGAAIIEPIGWGPGARTEVDRGGTPA